MTTAETLRAAVCVGSYLPPSETFIYDQLVHQRRIRACVIARDRTQFATRFPYDDVVHLGAVEQMGFCHTGLAPTVTRALRQRRTQLIHAHFGPNGTRMLPFAKKLGIPLAVSFHGHDVGGLQRQHRRTLRYGRYQKLAPELFDVAETLLCASEELRTLLAEFGAPEEKLVLHQLGVDTTRFAPDPHIQRDGNQVLMVGRLVEKKGMKDGIAAFAKISDRFPAARLRIVGDGPLRSELMRQVEGLDLRDRVVFCGAIASEEVLREMQRTSVLLTPSFTTPSGDRESGVIVIKEAGASGLPTVATRHGGIPEILVEGRTGFMVAERDVETFSERLAALLEAPQKMVEMGKAARRHIVEKYDSVRQNEALEEHLIRAAHRAPAN